MNWSNATPNRNRMKGKIIKDLRVEKKKWVCFRSQKAQNWSFCYFQQKQSRMEGRWCNSIKRINVSFLANIFQVMFKILSKSNWTSAKLLLCNRSFGLLECEMALHPQTTMCKISWDMFIFVSLWIVVKSKYNIHEMEICASGSFFI